MENNITLFSPAKINLFLDIKAKRSDGYHELSTIFAKLNFGDNIKLKIRESEKTSIKINATGKNGDKIPTNESNLIYKACEKFLDYFKISARVEIDLEKNIPVGAGLGGGSSNAGVVLKGLAEILNKKSDSDFEQIKQIATKLGADVPLFLYDNTFLKGEGIGEVLTPIKISTKKNLPTIILLYPGFGIETKQIFQSLDKFSDDNILTKSPNVNKIMLCLADGCLLAEWGDLLFNKLEFCAISLNPNIEKVKRDFRECGAKYVLMSGSGSCVYALVSDSMQAKEIAKKLKSRITTDDSLVAVADFL